MTQGLQDQLSRAAALGLLAVLVWLVIANLILPLAQDVVGDSRQVQSILEQRDQLATLVSRRPALLAEQRTIEHRLATSNLLWNRMSDAATAARVQSVVRAAMPSGGQITSVSEGALSNDHQVRRMTLRFEASAPLDMLARWMAAIETSRPSLFLDRLSITASPQSDPARPPYLSIECDVSAYLDRPDLR